MALNKSNGNRKEKGTNTEMADATKRKLQKPIESKHTMTIRGKPKSGRIWKSEKTRFNSIIKVKGTRTRSVEKKKQLEAELKRVREQSRAIADEMRAKKVRAKEQRRQNLQRQRENSRKSEIVQVITNTSKLRAIKNKKQMRNIEKRDTNST